MLNAIFILSDNYNNFTKKTDLDKHCHVCHSIVIDPSNKDKLKKAYQFFTDNNLINFSLSITLSKTLEDDVAEYIVSFFFLPCYYQLNGDIALNLICQDENISDTVVKKIINVARTQGIENISFNHFNVTEIIKDYTNGLQPLKYIFHSTASLLAQYAGMLQSEKFYNNILGLWDTNIDLNGLNAELKQAEERAIEQSPLKFKMARYIQSLLTQNNTLKKENKYLKNELDNYREHIKLLKSSHEAKILQDWYHNEYEILPLWYKQFGHIIKVIMGKRSFRSVFSDKVKKYNN